jgi:LPS sulfotransferase NodH
MSTPASYVLCGTPRTGSTLLCSLLAATGVLGRPESYFRGPDEVSWAGRFGLPHDGSQVVDYGGFIGAVRAAATTNNGVFGARVMWGSMDRIVTGLKGTRDRSDLAVLERALGPLRFVHLWREDVVAQAVSWCRAEQSGFWQQGDSQVRLPHLDLDQMKEMVGTIREHNAEWQSWFTVHGVRPHTVTFEQLVQDSRATVEGIACLVGVIIPEAWRPSSQHQKQADGLNAEWESALRAALQAANRT